MISNELSIIREKDAERAWLATLTAEYEQRGQVLAVVPIIARSPDIDTLFNNRTKDGWRPELHKSLEQKVAEAGPTLTRAQAAERFHLSIADLNTIADRHGFKFKRGSNANKRYIEAEAGLVQRITALRDVGLNRAQVMKQTGISYDRFHRLLKDYEIVFPKRSNGGYAGRRAS